MKVGQIFDLPENILYELGHIGVLKDKDGNKLGKYEVVKVGDELKGKVITTYDHKRKHK